MRSNYPLFQSHLDLAHHYWERLVQPGDTVIDATCGNGQDTLKLAYLVLREDEGLIYACDLQEKALEQTHNYLKAHLSRPQLNHVQLKLGCHAQFPKEIQPQTVKLIVYNLGYLPKGNKAVTTQTATTLQSLEQAQSLIIPGGAISITCYPGHVEGALEQEAILMHLSNWAPKEWNCCHHHWLNRHKSPSLILLQKRELD